MHSAVATQCAGPEHMLPFSGDQRKNLMGSTPCEDIKSRKINVPYGIGVPLPLAGQWLTSSTRMQDEAKREHEVKTIGTHGGLFHCDEVLACYMLKVLPEYKDARYMYVQGLISC